MSDDEETLNGRRDEGQSKTSDQTRDSDRNGGKSENDHKTRPREDDKGQEAGNKKKPLSKSAKIIIAILALVIAAAGIGYGVYWWLRGSYYQSTNDAYLQADQVNIAPRVSGYVEAVLVSENQIVAAGQPLIRISSRDYQARVDQDEAQIGEASASVQEAEAHVHQQQAQITQNEMELSQNEAERRQYVASARFNESEARRYRPLAASGAETVEKLANYTSQAQQARAQVDAAQAKAAAGAAKIEYAKRQIDVYREQRASALAKIRRAESQLAADKVDLDATAVVSSIAGRVGDRTVRLGQYLQTGTRVMTIVPVDALYLKANFKETQIGLMRVGQPAHITVDALGDMTLNGVVESFSPGTGTQFALVPTDNATGNFTKVTQRVPVRIRVNAGPESRKVLVPGLSVTVEVDTIGAKSDVKAQSEESRDDRRERRAEDRRGDAQDRRDHRQGAGNE